jgi:hypothetical protein
MSALEAQLREFFAQLGDGDQPPARVSVTAATSRGRSMLRWRRVRLSAPPMLAASAVLAVALTGALPAGRSGGHPAARTPASSHAAKQPPPRTVAPDRFSLLVPYASFGWLPAGYSLRSGGTRGTSDFLNAYDGRHFRWQLTTYAASVCSLTRTDGALVCSFGQDGTQTYPLSGRAPAVAGHRAFWLSAGPHPQDKHQAVIWQYATNGWAELHNASSAHEPSMTLLRIAGNVGFGTSRQPMRFAVQLTRVPEKWRVSTTFYQISGGVPVDDQATFAAAGSNPADLPFVTTQLSPGSCYFYPDGQSKHEVINGYRVVVNTIPAADGRPPTYQVCAPDVNGLFVFISVAGSRPVITPVTLFRHLRVLGASPADWVTSPTS